MQKVWQEREDIREKMRESRFNFMENGYNVCNINKPVLDSCYADKRYQATINYDGKVFKCTARDFNSEAAEGILSDDGYIIWNEKFAKRLGSKFNISFCKECRILPLCGCGCTQHAIEYEGKEYCVLGFNEDAKTKIIIDKFKTIFV